MDRRTLIRDVAMLQAKLIVDGFRDLVLVPVSIAAGIISLLSGKDGEPGPHFYHLLGVGKQSEKWINLFGALKNAPPDMEHVQPFPDTDMDDIVGHIESFVVDEERRGGMTAQARERLERVLSRLQNRRNAHAPGRTDGDQSAP